MQAIILAAGMGKRLGKLTSENTKCMTELNCRVLSPMDDKYKCEYEKACKLMCREGKILFCIMQH